MKTKLLIAILLISLRLSGQSASTPYNNNTVSIAPFGLLFGSAMLSYERALTPKTSLELETGLKLSGGVIRINGFDSPTIKTNDFQFRGITLTPGFRWYPVKGNAAHSGFYLGAYYRFRTMSDKVQGTYTSSSTNMESPVDMDVKITGNTFGFQTGYKLPVYKGFSLDFLIAGPGVTFGEIAIKENKLLPDDFFNDASNLIRNNFAFLDPYLENIKFSRKGNTDASADFLLPTFRYSIKVSYSF